MAALGVLATTAITAVTAQNTTAVTRSTTCPLEMVDAQIDAVLDDLDVRATKTGMLGTAECVTPSAGGRRRGDLPRLVVDPVMVASTGRVLLADDGVGRLPARASSPMRWSPPRTSGRRRSSPACRRRPAGTSTAMVEMARRIHKLGPAWVLVKGGHLPGVAVRAMPAEPPSG